MRTQTCVALAVSAAVAGACRSEDAVWVGVGAWGFAVTAVDGASGAPAAAGATLVARSGAYADSMTATRDDEVLYGADDRPGRYDLTVRKPGYREWARAGLVVPATCGTIPTTSLTARLVRP